MAERTVRFFSLLGTDAVMGHRHVTEAWAISQHYRCMSLSWALESYLDAEGLVPAACPEIPVAGYREPCRTRAFRDPAPEQMSDGSTLLWVSWLTTPRLAAQLARVGDSLSHRQEEAVLGAAYGLWLDKAYPAAPLGVISGRVADLRTLRPPRHRRLKAHRARLAAAPELELAV